MRVSCLQILELKSVSVGEGAIAEALAEAESVLTDQGNDGRVRIGGAGGLLLPRRLGPARGVGRKLQEVRSLQLSKALHMVRALRLGSDKDKDKGAERVMADDDWDKLDSQV